jgi:hypothetical protein
LHRLWLRRFPVTYDRTTSAYLGGLPNHTGYSGSAGKHPSQRWRRRLGWKSTASIDRPRRMGRFMLPCLAMRGAEPRRLAAEPQVIVEMTVLVATLSRIVLAIVPGRSLRARAAATVARQASGVARTAREGLSDGVWTVAGSATITIRRTFGPACRSMIGPWFRPITTCTSPITLPMGATRCRQRRAPGRWQRRSARR